MSKRWILPLLLMTTAGLYARPKLELAIPLQERHSAHYTFHIDRVASTDGARTYRIVTAIPKKAPTREGYPVVYALDGNAVLQHLSEEHLKILAGGEAPVIVAVGYETEGMFDLKSRAFDYTPARSDGLATIDPLDPTRTGGGAGVFLAFFEKTLIPLAEAKARIDAHRRVLFGHSYGGLFVLRVLMDRPDLFRDYVSADPSLWWQDGDFYRQMLGRAASLNLANRKVFLVKGGLEDPSPSSPQDIERVQLRKRLYAGIPKDATLELSRALAAKAGARIQYLEFGQLSHGPLFPVALGLALQSAAEP